MRLPLYALAFLLAAYALTRNAAPSLEIIDGDTIRIQGERFRLANHDAPEISHPGCEHCRQPACLKEEVLGQLARQRLYELTRGDLSITHVPCIHKTERNPRDRYGRQCIVLKVPVVHVQDNCRPTAVHGVRECQQGTEWVDVGDSLIRENLAVPFPGPKKDWCK